MGPWGDVCASRSTHITGDRNGHTKWSAVARPGKYDETGSCKVTVFMQHRSHLKQVSCETTICPGNRGACLRHNYPHTYVLYCNLYRNWHWHYMWFTVIDPWNCPCKATVLTHICLTLNSFCPTHETGHVKPLFCHRMALHGFYVGQPMKLPLYAKPVFAIHSHCMGLHWSTHETVYVKPASRQTLELHGAHPGRPIKLRM